MRPIGRRAALSGVLAAPALVAAAEVRAVGPTATSATVAQPVSEQPPGLRGSVDGNHVTLPPLHEPSEVEAPTTNRDPLASKLGVAIVGLGHLSIDQILPGTLTSRFVRVTALVSGNPAKARAIGAQYGVADRSLYDYAGFDRLRDDPNVDFVYVVLPNDMHEEFTVRAARAGKHVLCEKPMATTVPAAERMVAACREADRLLMIAYRMQYNPYHRALISMARSGAIGPVRAISAVNGQNDRPDGQWRQVLRQAGGGSLPDVGLYCLNAARYITGEEPIAITAQITQPKDDPRFREVEDIAAFTLRFPSGVIANCMSGYSHHESRQLRVMARDAYVDLDPAFAYEGLSMKIGRKAGQAASVTQLRFGERNQFAIEMDHFAESIRAKRQPHTPGEEGLQDQRLIAAIYEAARGGGTITLPAVAGLDATRGPAPTRADG